MCGGTERTLECAFRLEAHLGRYRKNFGVCISAGSSFGTNRKKFGVCVSAGSSFVEVQKELWSVHLGWKLNWGGTERTLECAFRLEAHFGRYRKNFGVCI